MKIALFTDGLFPEFIGGMQKHSLLLMLNLAKQGVELEVYHPGKKTPDALQNLEENIRRNITLISVPFPKSVKFPGHYIWNSYRYSRAVYKAFKAQNSKIDFIYAQGFTGWNYIKNKTNQMSPIGINFHGLEMFQDIEGNQIKWQQRLLKPFTELLLKHADVVFSLGGKLTGIIESLKPNGKIIEIPIGIEEHWVIDEINGKKRESNLKVLFVGRNEWRKGLHLLKEVILNLDKIQNVNIEFGFVGDIPNHIETSQITCTYYGEIRDENKLKEVFQDHDVLVCPSLAEGMPTVILEAMANGLAIVATDTGATAELVNNKNGFLIEAGNTLKLEEALISMTKISPLELIDKQNVSLQKVNERFLWTQVAKNTITEISKFLHSRGQF